MVSDGTLPLEIFERILRYALLIQVDTFLAFRTNMTFVCRERSPTPDLLLVSKHWKTIGTPLLYEAVILRTRDQVAALYGTLSSNVELRAYIRRLRVEVAFNSHVNAIISFAPRTHTFFLSVDSRNSLVRRRRPGAHPAYHGFIDALRKINPTHVLLDLSDGINAELDTQNAVVEAALTWSNVERLDFSDALRSPRLFMRILLNAPRLKAVSVIPELFEHPEASEALGAIPTGIGLEAIHCRRVADLRACTSVPQHLLDILCFKGGISAAMISGFQQPSDMPELPEEIWERIIVLATRGDPLNNLELTEELRLELIRERVNDIRCNITLVSKKFRRLGTPYLWSIPIIPDIPHRSLLIMKLQMYPELARLVRVLRTFDLASFNPPALYIRSLTTILLAIPSVEMLTMFGLRLDTDECSPLISLTQRLRENMQDFTVPPLSLLRFPRLRFLSLSRGEADLSGSIPVDALPELKTLKMMDCGPSLMKLFAEMRLPKLREFHADGDQANDVRCLLQHHGAKLERLSVQAAHKFTGYSSVLDLCPNIVELCIDDVRFPPPLQLLSNARRHVALRRISFPYAAVFPDVNFDSGRCREFFATLDTRPFVALSEICLPSKFRWPHDEVTLHHSPFRDSVKQLLQHGVAFTNSEGRRWTRI